MKKLILIFTMFSLSCSTEEQDISIDNTDKDDTEESEKSDFTFYYNLHSSLNDYYKDSIKSIIGRLEKIIPVEIFNGTSVGWGEVNGVSVYSWKKGESKPFYDEIGDTDQCICGYIDNKLIMSLQMTSGDLDYDGNFKYALLAHEYFHVFQMYHSLGLNIDNFWLIEGQAATIESLYVKEFHSDPNYLKSFLENDFYSWEDAINNVTDYEVYGLGSHGDITVFMILTLSKLLQDTGVSEEKAFQIILQDFWKTKPSNNNWKLKFSETFSMTVEEFYLKLNDFKDDPMSVMPSHNLKLENIFK